MANNATPIPVSGSNHRAPKRKHGRHWLLERPRNGLNWKERKLRSHRYCPPTSGRQAR